MAAFDLTKILIKKLIIPASFMSIGLMTASIVHNAPANAAAADRTPGSFVCDNNPDPACDNPKREVTGDWRCTNNPGPECDQKPSSGAAQPSGWDCVMNQNVVACDNPIRFSVQDPATWPSRFSTTGATSTNTTGQ